MPRKHVVVCGVTGFIGRNVAEALAVDSRYQVTGVHFSRPAFAHPGIRFLRADLTDPTQVDRVVSGADIVVQAAATTSGAKDLIERPNVHITDNAVMNSLILQSVYKHRIERFVFFSCTLMYASSDRPVRETDFDANREFYPPYFGAGWTKVYAEKMCEFYSRVSDTKFTVLRHSNIFGPHDKFDLEHSHVFGATVSKVMTTSDGRIVVWGTGEEERDLLYVTDLVDCVRHAIEAQSAAFGLYNVGCGRSISVRDLVRKIIEVSGREISIEYDPDKPSLKTKLALDTSKILRAFGWKPRFSLEDGIERTLAWYRSAKTK